MLANKIKYDLLHNHHWDTILTFCSNISIPLEDAKNSFLHLTVRRSQTEQSACSGWKALSGEDGSKTDVWALTMLLKVSPCPLLTIVTNPPRLAVLCLDLVIHRFDSDCWQESFSWLQRWQKNPSPILYHQLILSHRLMTFSNKNSFYNIIALKENVKSCVMNWNQIANKKKQPSGFQCRYLCL